MKKLISIVLCLGLVLITVPASASSNKMSSERNAYDLIADAFGQNSTNTEQTEALVKIVESDMDNISSLGIDKKSISISGSRGNDILYAVQYGDIVNQVAVNEDSQGNLTIDFFEGNLHNILTIMNDGSLILDGNEVIFSSITIDERDSINAFANARYTQFSTSPVRGTAADYNKYVCNYKVNVIDANGSLLISLAVGTFTTILCSAINASMGISVAANAITTIASTLRSVAETHAPNSAFLSFSVDKYQHKTTYPMEEHYKYTGNYYVQKDRQGYATPHTFYEYNYFS